MSHTAGRGRRRIALVALAAATISQIGVGAATAAPASPVTNGGAANVNLTADQLAALRAAAHSQSAVAGLPASGPAAFLIELNTASSGSVFQSALPRGETDAEGAARNAKASITDLQNAVLAALPANSSLLYRTAALTAGVAVTTDVSNYAALWRLPNVKAVHPIVPKTTDNAGAATLINTPQVWEALGNTGQNVDIGVIDTGIDYTHTDFGGSGSVAQYNAIHAHEAQPAPVGVFPNAKVTGGTDFVGDAYDGTNTPRPDPNPLDCQGHGSHVSGTAAGYGVNTDGSTYRGPYNADVDLTALRIGPGMAPGAHLQALRVFGCEGSTNVVGEAIEYAADPNGDGSTNDRLDVLNLSLGSDFGIPDDADSIIANNAMALGIVMSIAAGNAGDTYDIGGSPGNAPRVIGVAASNDGYGVFDGWEIINRPDLFDPDVRPGLRSVAYLGSGDVTGDLALPVPGDDPTACTPLHGDYSGKFLIIEAAGFACGSVTKSGNAKAAGADGFVIVSDDDLLETGITGDPDIPGILVTASDGAVLEQHVAAGEQLTIHFGDSLKDAAKYIAPEQQDLIASFTSRGVRQEGNVKPDVSAPGVTLFSAANGTGSQGLTESGTSMATPVTAGVSALIRSQHPSWSTELIKADIMNTANHELYTGLGQTGLIYAPNRVGAGRIDAAQALANNVLAYVQDDPGVVSASFGVVEVADATVTRSKTIRVENKGARTQTYNVHYEPATVMPGVQYSFNRTSITVGPSQTGTITVTMTATRDQMRKTIDPTVSPTQVGVFRQYVADASGRLVLTSTTDSPDLRVPVHANPKPISTLSQNVRATGPNTGSITLTGQGVTTRQPLAPGAYTSTVSGFELLGSSGTLPQCGPGVNGNCYSYEGERSVDLANVGVTSDAPFRNSSVNGSSLYFAVSSRAPAPNPASVVNNSVYIDATGDGQWDYQLVTTRLVDGADPVDVPVVIGIDRNGSLLPSDDAPVITFLNVASGRFDTSIFDSDVQIMSFPVAALPGINQADPRFSFGVQATSVYGSVDDVGTRTTAQGTVELTSAPMSFDAATPGLVFTDPVDNGLPALLSIATNGATVPVTRNPGSYAADQTVGGPKGILLIYTHNGNGHRAPAIPVPSAGAIA